MTVKDQISAVNYTQDGPAGEKRGSWRLATQTSK